MRYGRFGARAVTAGTSLVVNSHAFMSDKAHQVMDDATDADTSIVISASILVELVYSVENEIRASAAVRVVRLGSTAVK